MTKQLRGDINNDGKISEIDMQLVFAYKSGEINLNADELVRADTDGDGSVSINDALNIKRHIEGIKLIDGVI